MLRAVSIRQPWTELILRGRKTIEVRSWPTNFRGALWIHAGLRADPPAINTERLTSEGLPRGAILGSCDLYDCIPLDAKAWEALRCNHLVARSFQGPLFAWLLRGAARCAPIPLVGRLGIMRLDDSILTRQ